MRCLRTSSFVIVILLLSKLSFSQQQWPSSFLWRITGHGLTKPSYLYGTIHLQDKRLFQFSDSLYHSLENVDGFALEIDFSEFMDSVFSRTLDEAEKDFLDEHEKIKVDKKKIDKSVDSILRTLKLDPDRLTRKDLKRIRDYRMNRLVQQGEMKTIVDGYLYGLAGRLGKWTGGIEDVVDQLDLMDEMGADLTTEEVFQPESKLRLGVQEMIKIYASRDLQSLNDYIEGSYTKNYRDELLIHRNIKMARRMDSLSSLRTMFFAVGAAHLPGDSGVINLLRSRGFTVEPVFSPQSITPEVYSARLNNIPWKKVESDELYTINMPGNPSDYNLFGQAVKMKIFFDLPTMTFYMSGRTIATSNSTVNIDDAVKNMAERFGSNPKKVKVKDVSSGDLIGKEGRFDIADFTYVVRFLQKKSTLYILMIGSAGKGKLDNADIDKFFTSFSPNEIAATDKKWTEFTIPGKGFTIKMPGTPRPNIAIDKKSIGTNWRFTTYDLPDNEKGLYYLFQLREAESGFFLEGDSSYFSLYKQSMADVFEKILSEEQFTYKGWPAFKLEFAFNTDGIYRIYSVMRGNRIYMLAAGGDKKADLSEMDQAFHSLTFEELPAANWKKYQSEGFSSTAPGHFVKRDKDSTNLEEDHFVSYDPHEIVSYEVFRTPISPYYWVKNDSIYFDEKIKAYKYFNDSILQREVTYNGKLKAVDFLVQKPSNNTLRRIRMFVNGDSLYTLMVMSPAQYRKNENLNKFFSDFRVEREIAPTIYSNKAKQLFEALKTKDSAEFAKVSAVLSEVTFEETDRALLHEALLEIYLSEYEYRSVNARIVDILEKLADHSTIEFIQKNYKTLSGDKEVLKYNLLEVLADMKTSESYSMLKKLALESPPAKGEEYRLSYSLTDSLLLAKTLYPEILQLSTDSLFSQVLVKVTNELLDSSFLTVNDVVPFKQNFLKQANNYLQLLKEDEDKWWAYSTWIRLIGKFNDKASNQLLTEYLQLKKIDVSYYAVIELARNGQEINAAEIERLAADKNYRANLFDELKKIGKNKIFPAKYSTQKKIAEGEIYQMAYSDNDEIEPESINFLGEKTVEFMGKLQTFYLFRIDFKVDDYASSYLGITGPYAKDNKEIIVFNKATAILWDEEFDKKKMDEQFKKLVSEQEGYLKENEEGLKK